MLTQIRDLTNQRFGRLLAINPREDRDNNHVVWDCVCDCGSQLPVRSSSLVCGQTRSCGCLVKDTMSKLRSTHKMSNTPTYHSWKSMQNRCKYAKHPAYHRYGGAGVRVCDSWSTFAGFYADMGTRPEGTSLDRINNLLGYSPDNCRWATHKEQAINKLLTKYAELTGITLTLHEWGEISGVKPPVISRRLAAGVSPVVSVFYPAKHGTRMCHLLSEAAAEISESRLNTWKEHNPNVVKCAKYIRSLVERNRDV